MNTGRSAACRPCRRRRTIRRRSSLGGRRDVARFCGRLSTSKWSRSPCALQLTPLPTSLPPFANAAGTFGNLTLPSNVTIAESGTVLLLDVCERPCCAGSTAARAGSRTSQHIGGLGAPVRHWKDPHAIAARGAYLYVCDTGHERVAVYTLNGLAFSGDLRRRPAASYPHWEPYAIAFDSQGDGAGDRSRGAASSIGSADAASGSTRSWVLAADRDRHRLHRSDLRRADKAQQAPKCASSIGRRLASRCAVAARSAHVRRFRRLPFEVDTSGVSELGPLCDDSDPSCCADSATRRTGSTPAGIHSRRRRPQHADLHRHRRDHVRTARQPRPADASGTGSCCRTRAGSDEGSRRDLHGRRVVRRRSSADARDVGYRPDGAARRRRLGLPGARCRRTLPVDQAHADVDGRSNAAHRSAHRRVSAHQPPPIPAGDVRRRAGERRFHRQISGVVRHDVPERRSVRSTTEARCSIRLSTPSRQVDGAPIDFLTWLGTWVGV